MRRSKLHSHGLVSRVGRIQGDNVKTLELTIQRSDSISIQLKMVSPKTRKGE